MGTNILGIGAVTELGKALRTVVKILQADARFAPVRYPGDPGGDEIKDPDESFTFVEMNRDQECIEVSVFAPLDRPSYAMRMAHAVVETLSKRDGLVCEFGDLEVPADQYFVSIVAVAVKD